MNVRSLLKAVFACGAAALAGGATADTIYNNIPPTLAGNYPSLGYQATSTKEFGDRVMFGGTNRQLTSVTVTMSSWAKSEDFGNAVSFTHPLTMNIYAEGTGGLPGALLGTVTQTFTIPFRPTGWGFNGIAANVTFDCTALNLTLPDAIVYGLAYNTQSYGTAPIGTAGPYNSLNFALNTDVGGGITVGSNFDLDDTFWNTSHAPFYADGGVGGVGILRRDTDWTGYTPMARFNTDSISLNANSCYKVNDTIVVLIEKSATGTAAAGGQFFLAYDTSKLQYLGSAVGDAPYTLPVFSASGPGTVDYAVGDASFGPGTTAPAVMARISFKALTEICEGSNLVTFRTHTPPTRLSDSAGAPIPTVLNNLGSLTIDSTPPVITCPPNITVNADAGGCTAVVNLAAPQVQTFDSNPAIGAVMAPGVWYTDRYAPAGFASAFFDGDNRLKHSISAADCESCRPMGFNSAFYNTQGRKYDTLGGNAMSIELYVPAAWATTGKRMAGFWGTGFDASNAVSLYPIIEFTSDTGTPRFRAYNNGVWIDLGLPTGFMYDEWQTLNIQLVGPDVIYTVGDLTATIPALGTVKIDNVILQGHNSVAGETYDIYWDNFAYGQYAFAYDTCDTNPTITGTRSDMLPLGAPYPAGVTTNVTWQATDCSGNVSTCIQAVTVNAVNMLTATVELLNVNTTTFDRCITFDFFGAGCPAPAATVNAVITFTNRVGTVTIPVPCGSYTCVTARDRLHSLRRTANPSHFGISGLNYVANFVNDGPLNNDALIGGNLNDDQYIDILDFGAYVNQFGATYGSVNTTCSTPFFHADINGDGSVTILDYSFISINFLTFREADCCGTPLVGDFGPISDISVFELAARGDWDIARSADLDRDGRVNLADVIFLSQNGVSTCVADYNNQGGVSVDDLFSFINGWFTGHPAADVDNNRAVVIDDLFGYLNVYFVGCN